MGNVSFSRFLSWRVLPYFPVLGFVLAALFCVSCQDPGLMERVTDEEAGEYTEDLAAQMLATTLGIKFDPNVS